MANPFGKTRDVENPYAVYMGWSSDIGPIEIRVLRRYKGSVKTESKDPYAKWFTAAKSDATFGSWEYGDQYVNENPYGIGIRNQFQLFKADPEWVEQYARRV
jgi:hypothetical protein